MVRQFLAATFLATLLAAGSYLPAHAQATVAKPIQTPDGQPLVRGRRPTEALPSAVPGARAEPAVVAPYDRSPLDMPPTEALFDAINRGDTVTAREAIGRGADIHGRNVLGMTPLEQSVDLGRSDISFLLLSLRSGAGYGDGAAPRGTTDAKGSPAETRAQRRTAALQAAQQASQERREQLAASRTNAASSSAPASNARLFAGDGGAPVPQAGFLGFGSSRQP